MVVLATVLLTGAGWLGTAQAEPISFKVPLSGGQEVPPVFPAGAGTAELTYDSATRVLTWTVTYMGLVMSLAKLGRGGIKRQKKYAMTVSH
jgi:hypothetical protein